MNAPVGLVFNPGSHTVQRKGSLLEAAAASIPGAQLVRLDDFSNLDAQMTGLANAGVRSVFVEGGDGTLQAVLSACFALHAKFHGLPEFAILPGGSTNLAYKVCGLRLHEREQIVDFIARFRDKSGETHAHHERSLFVKEKGRWLFREGHTPQATVRRTTPKVGRNDPCSCGSGKKFKKCCEKASAPAIPLPPSPS